MRATSSNLLLIIVLVINAAEWARGDAWGRGATDLPVRRIPRRHCCRATLHAAAVYTSGFAVRMKSRVCLFLGVCVCVCLHVCLFHVSLVSKYKIKIGQCNKTLTNTRFLKRQHQCRDDSSAVRETQCLYYVLN